MDLDTAGKRAQVVAALAAAPSLTQLRALLFYVVKSTVQAAALKADPPPSAADVALLLATVPAARGILATSQAGRAAIKRADAIKPAPAVPPTGPSPVAAAVSHLKGRAERLRASALVRQFPMSVVEHACRSLEEVDQILAGMERMADAARSADFREDES